MFFSLTKEVMRAIDVCSTRNPTAARPQIYLIAECCLSATRMVLAEDILLRAQILNIVTWEK